MAHTSRIVLGAIALVLAISLWSVLDGVLLILVLATLLAVGILHFIEIKPTTRVPREESHVPDPEPRVRVDRPRGKVLIFLGLVAAILAKSSKAIALLFPFYTLASMTIFALAYSFFLGPWLAIGIAGMVLIHELGHVWAVRIRGLTSSMPFFVPFVGAVVGMKSPGNRSEEAFIGIMGPVVGALGVLLLLLVWWISQPEREVSTIMLSIALFGAWLNLINLFPAKPLDGGRVVQAASDVLWVIGLFALSILGVWTTDILILTIVLFGLREIKSISHRLKAALGAVVMAAVTYVISPISDPDSDWFWLKVVGACACLLLVFLQAKSAYRPTPEEVTEWEREKETWVVLSPLPGAERILWSLCYVGLLGSLIALAFWIGSMLKPLLERV